MWLLWLFEMETREECCKNNIFVRSVCILLPVLLSFFFFGVWYWMIYHSELYVIVLEKTVLFEASGFDCLLPLFINLVD